MRKEKMAMCLQEPVNRIRMKLIKSLRIVALLIGGIMMSYDTSAQGESISADACRCTSTGSLVESVITIVDSTQGANPWILIDYDGISLPDSVLWHHPNQNINDEFYLSFDQSSMSADTLSNPTMTGGNWVYTLTAYRRASVAFNNVVFIRTHMGVTDTLIVSLAACTPDGVEGLVGAQGISGRDTVCLNSAMVGNGARFDFTAPFDTTMIDTVWWTLSGPGANGTPFDMGQRFADVVFTMPGNYVLRAFGNTVTNCPINGMLNIHVVDTDIAIEGFTMGCAMGDTMPFSLSSNFSFAVYDSVIWEIIPPSAGTFIGSSVNVSSVNILWSNTPGTYEVRVRGEKNNGLVCNWDDSLSVTIDTELTASVTSYRAPDSISNIFHFCEGDRADFRASILNLDTILWYLGDSSTNVLVGDPRADSISVIMNQVGLDTLYLIGRTLGGCEIRDTIVIDAKDDDIMLTGSTNVCQGETVGYMVKYSDGSIANFVEMVSWQVTPADPSMNIQIDTVRAPNDSLTVTWANIGNHQIIVSGLTSIGCNILDTINVNVQDTNFLILGETLACAGDVYDYQLVQAFDSTRVISNDTSVRWRIVRSIMVGSMPLERPEYPDSTIDMAFNDDILYHSFSTGTFRDEDSYYLVIAEGVTDNGCPFSDTLRVETIGQPDLTIEGPDEVCSGKIDTFTFTLPDSLMVPGTPTWSAYYMDGTPIAPFYLNQIAMDTLIITFPNQPDSFRVNFSAQVVGSGCAINSNRIVSSIDTIGFIAPADSTICLTGDTTWFVINVDTSNVDTSTIAFSIENMTTSAITNLDATHRFGQLAAYTIITEPGQYEVQGVGYTYDNCRIGESFILTVKDTNYVIAGDDQVCVGDTIMYVFRKGWNNRPVDTLVEWNGPGSDTIQWTITSQTGGASPTLIQYTGIYSDTLLIAFDSAGTYQLLGEGTTECCFIDAEFNVTVRGSDFLLLGPDVVCDGTSNSIYYIANTDSTRINDLHPDSTTWTLSSGRNSQINAATSADSLVMNWDLPGSFSEAYDTIYFRGVSDDGCVIYDTLPVVVHTSDYSIIGSLETCIGTPVDVILATSFDSSEVIGIDTLYWVINGTDTITTPSVDTLDRLDTLGLATIWSTPGTYRIEAIGTTEAGCIIYERTDVEVYDIPDVMIDGDQHTCFRTNGRLVEPDIYTLLNITDSQIESIQWTIIPYGPYPQPIHEGLTNNQLVVREWTSLGNAGIAEDYRIRVTGTSTGGCAFADSIDVVIRPTTPAFSMICNNAINVTLSHSCEVELTPDMILQGWDSLSTTLVPEEFEIRIKDPETGAMLSNQGVVDLSMIGKRIEIEIEHECSGQTCWGYVTIEDKNIPDLICTKDTLSCSDNYLPDSLNFGPGRKAGYPIPDSSDITITRAGDYNTFIVRGYEKCSDATLVYNDRIEREICDGDVGTIIYRDWTMTNLAGISTTCTDTLYFRRLHIDTFMVMFEDQLRDSIFECGENVTPFTNPTFDLDDFCFNIKWSATVHTDYLCGDSKNTYNTTKTWTFIDWCDGTVRKRSQTIAVEDRRGPSIILNPSDLRPIATDDICYGVIELTHYDILIQDSSLCSDIERVIVEVYDESLSGIRIAREEYNGNFTSLIISDPNLLTDLSRVRIVVEAYDQCGNVSVDTVSRRVFIDDNVAPDPVCDQEVVISLNDEGWGYASWRAFDRKSNDNCGVDDICISRVDDEEIFKSLDTDKDYLVPYADFAKAINEDGRDGTNYSKKVSLIKGEEYIHFDSLCVSKLKFECKDAEKSALGKSIAVRMKVTDIFGNYATCLSNVEVRDNNIIDHLVVIKGDTTLPCGTDYSAYIPYDGDETVRFVTSCGRSIKPYYDVDTSGLNSCGIGHIRRLYTARDRKGGEFTHVQTIYIGDQSEVVAPGYLKDFWPEDYIGKGCPGSGLSPDHLEARYVPKWNSNDYPCSNADLIYEDLPFYNSDGFCLKILRTWTLIDWCQKDKKDPNAGKWEHVQILKINDKEAPHITMDPNVSVSTTSGNSCSAFVSLEGTAKDCFDDKDLSWSYRIEQGGALIDHANSQTINRDLAEGIYTVKWSVEDKCGNRDKFTQTVAVIDGGAPSISCQDLTVNLGNGARATVFAEDLVGNMSDACDGELDIFFDSPTGSKSRAFDCTDMNGQSRKVISQTIVAVDDRGNVGECQVRITLTDRNNTCDRTDDNPIYYDSLAILGGTVFTTSEYKVDNVELTLVDQDNVAMHRVMTPESGQFEFDKVPMGKSYNIKATRSDDYDNGVSTFDLLIIQRHILGLRSLSTPYQMIAADVNGSQTITGADLIDIRRLLLGKTTELPIGKSWTFVDADQEFSEPLSPWPYRDYLSVAGLSDDQNDLNLFAVKLGDLNGNARMASAPIADTRSRINLVASISRVEEGLLAIKLTPDIDQSVTGLQADIQLNTDLVRFVAVGSHTLDVSEQDYVIDEYGMLRIALANEKAVEQAAITIYVSTNSTDAISIDNIITLSDEHLDAQVYTEESDAIISHSTTIMYEAGLASTATMEVMQNVPNPFVNSTKVAFYNPTASDISIRVYNTAGRLVHSQAAPYTTGWHNVIIRSDELDGPGVYIYEINNGTEIVRKRMMSL